MPQRIMRGLLTRIGFRQAKPARGFTIVEVMVAFAVVLIVLIGLTSALTASMRLNTTQKQRALAQDIVRDVVSTYVKNAPYDEINPFTVNATDGSCSNCSNVTQVIYDGSNNTNNITNYTGLPSLLAEELATLQQPKLELLISPIKKTATEFYATKINVLARLSWDGGGQRVVEMPSVVGMGDLTRTDRARFEKPVPTPTPADSAVSCTGVNQLLVGGSLCCPGLIESAGACIVDPQATCGEEGLPPVLGQCCGDLVNDNGVCTDPDAEPEPTCGEEGLAPVNGQCCGQLINDGGVCSEPPACLTSGTACAIGGDCSQCCSGYTPVLIPGMGMMAATNSTTEGTCN